MSFARGGEACLGGRREVLLFLKKEDQKTFDLFGA
jgi:hypothetical protein